MSNTIMATKLKGSNNYIWWEKDELGKGATATVYKCREKKTGDVYAVKVFSNRHRDRPNYHESAQQEREFSLLQKLKHDNIVKMLSIEEESQTAERPASRVIVMEYCNGGSLYSILEQPANAYGLEEPEFLLFLKHIAQGMQYLREQKVVHRDIKPGNIMKLTTSEGRSVYKLTDFGAARKLEADDECFTSLYGTEEYLHPDLYDRAVIRTSSAFGAKTSFTSSVDLWSVGVTIYHVATGSLPFRPYGGRRNRADMQQILTNKKRGVISGIQEKEGGRIVYDTKLPSTCKLSQGLQNQIVPLIAGLVETDINYCSDFNKFFNEVSAIVNKIIITVFDSCHCQLIKVYCDPQKDNLRRMKELIEEQCGYRPSEQLLLYENTKLDDETSDHSFSADKLPITTDTNPVLLYHCSDPLSNTDEHPIKHNIPKFSRFGSYYDLERDYQLAKTCTGIMKYICVKVKLTLSLQALLDKAVKAYEHNLIKMVLLLSDNIKMVICSAEEVRVRYSFMKDVAMLHTKNSMQESALKLTRKIENLSTKVDEMAQFIGDLKRYGEDYKEKLALRRELSHKWRPSSGCDPEKDMCADRVGSLTENVESCMMEFKRDKGMKPLPYNEEQIHKFEKNKMSESCTSALSLLDDHCWDRTKRMYKLYIQWFQMSFRIQTKIYKLKAKMARLKQMQEDVSTELNLMDQEIVHVVRIKCTTAQPLAPPAYTQPAAHTAPVREDSYAEFTSEMSTISQSLKELDYMEEDLSAIDSVYNSIESDLGRVQVMMQTTS